MKTRTFLHFALISIFALSCAQQKAGLKAISNDEGIEIRQNDDGILFYQVKPKSLDGKYERANYIHPLYSLKGNVITEDFPKDHLHHHGLYSAWHQILLNGTPIADGWVNENISWKVLDSRVEPIGNTMAIRSEVFWLSPVNGKTEQIAKEDVVITVHAPVPTEGVTREHAREFTEQRPLARLADVEPREVLLAKLAGAMKGNLTKAAGLFQAPLSQMARLAAALQEKKPAEAAAAPAEAAPAADAPADDSAAADTTTDTAASAIEEPAADAASDD